MFILIKFSLGEIFSLIDRLYGNIYISSVEALNCPKINMNDFDYRGMPDNVFNILDKYKISDFSNIKIEGYKLVYIPDIENNYNLVKIFPKSTIILVYDNTHHTTTKKEYFENHCFFLINIFYGYEGGNPYDNRKNIYYLVLDNKYQSNLYNLNLFLVSFFIPILFIVLGYYSYRLYFFIFYKKIHFYILTQRIILLSILLILSGFFLETALICIIIHSLFKSYLLINLVFLLNGYSIITFESNKKIYFIYLICIFLFDSVFNIIFEYIIYYLPKIDNFYFFIVKSLIEHIILLEYSIRSYKENYTHLYRQYEFELRLKTILASIYKIKLSIYIRIIIFSFIYSISFIVFQIIKLFYLHHYINSFYFCYYINSCIEIFFVLLLVIIFFPKNLGLFYYIPVIFDYQTNAFIVLLKDKKENELKISNLNKNILKNGYKTEYPLIFINPFSKSKNMFKDLHIGEIKNI